MSTNNPQDENVDLEFERLVQEAKSGARPSWDESDVLANCFCLSVPLPLCIAFGELPFFVLALLGAVASAFGGSSANCQAGNRLLLGCFWGFVYLVVMGTR